MANSVALRRAGLGDGSPDPPGAALGRDAAGRLDGRLIEPPAVALVDRLRQRPTASELADRLVALKRSFSGSGRAGSDCRAACWARLSTARKRSQSPRLWPAASWSKRSARVEKIVAAAGAMTCGGSLLDLIGMTGVWVVALMAKSLFDWGLTNDPRAEARGSGSAGNCRGDQDLPLICPLPGGTTPGGAAWPRRG